MSLDKYDSLEYQLDNTDSFISAIREIQFLISDGTPGNKIYEGSRQEIYAIKCFLFDIYKMFITRLNIDSHTESLNLYLKFCDDFHANAKDSTLCDTIEQFSECIKKAIKNSNKTDVKTDVKPAVKKSIKKTKKV